MSSGSRRAGLRTRGRRSYGISLLQWKGMTGLQCVCGDVFRAQWDIEPASCGVAYLLNQLNWVGAGHQGQTQSSCAQLQTRGRGSPLSAARMAPRYVPDGIGPGDGRSKWCIPGERRPKATRKIRVAFLRSILNDFLNEWLSKSGSFA